MFWKEEVLLSKRTMEDNRINYCYHYYSRLCSLLIFKMWDNSRCAPEGWSCSPVVSELGVYYYECSTDKLIFKVKI